VEQASAVASALEPLEPVARDDLIGVDIRARERQRASDDETDRLHQRRSEGSAKWPAIAVAAATAGDTRWVRPPGPCRPSKLRFEVEAQRSPRCSTSGSCQGTSSSR